ALCMTLGSTHSLVADEPTSAAARAEFFEQRIRPVLVEHCYECHNSNNANEGGLAVDFRDGLRKGGEQGPAIKPGDAKASLLLRAIQHADGAPRMPQGGPKLDARIVADFARWINDGAVDPRDQPPSAAELSAATSWEAVRERRMKWWSFQPIVKTPVPQGAHDSDSPAWQTSAAARSDHPVDRFLAAGWREAKLPPPNSADRETLLRRVTFALIGLPPSPEQVAAFKADTSDDAYARVVDQLLESPRFGERWARHWMDWLRYAESHGSEGDPAIPYAWRYRDYLIRAWNDDVPYNQLVREHLAGDLLASPRWNDELGIRESSLGLGHLRMVYHG
ncbi:MAG: DUF1549 domain-containing protein, partial [Planctomycetales bacterium]|nr:DUF1549 domain-containing protein [Planctomycetales bacterium]